MATRRARAATRVQTRGTADTRALPLFESAWAHLPAREDLARTEHRPPFLTTGLPSLDRALGGGLPIGGATLVAARIHVGATSFLIGAALAALQRSQPVSFFTERLRTDTLKGRFVVLESRVNGYRLRAGFASAEDRIAIAAARERIPWSRLSIVSRRRISLKEIDAHVFSYRPWLVIADLIPRPPSAGPDRLQDLLEGCERLALLAKRHRVALVLRMLLRKGRHPPDPAELPGLGASLGPFTAAVLLHRETGAEPTDGGPYGGPPAHQPHAYGEIEQTPIEDLGKAHALVVRAGGAEVSPREVPLRFDQRFAGLLER